MLPAGKTEGKRPVRRSRRRWMHNIKTDLGDIWWGDVDWIDLAQDRGQWRALVRTVMNLQVLYNAGKPEGSLHCSQEPSTGPCRESHQSSLNNPILSFKINFNIIHPPTFWSSWWSLLVFPPLTYMRSSSPHTCHMLCPSYPPRLDNPNYTWRFLRFQWHSRYLLFGLTFVGHCPSSFSSPVILFTAFALMLNCRAFQ
jgi:hypothetical protein